MFAAPTRALLLLSASIFAAADPPPSCLNVDRGQADGGDNACFEDDDVGMVCGWDGTPQEAYCTPRADGKKVCARWSAGGKCPEGSAVPDAACHDGGPFECKEEGCPPSGVVTCAELADACPARFDQVYDTSMPPGIDGATRVHQLCNCTCAGRERPPPRKPDRAAAVRVPATPRRPPSRCASASSRRATRQARFLAASWQTSSALGLAWMSRGSRQMSMSYFSET